MEDIEQENNNSTHTKRNYTWAEWVNHFKRTYGASVIVLLIFAYFNLGFRVMYILSLKDLFKMYLGLEPAEAQLFSSLISLPIALKILYGLMVDNIKFFHNSRKNYLKWCGVVMVLSLFLLTLPIMQNKYLTLMMLMIYSISTSVADVVCDAIMVTSSRKDPEHGSSDLQTLHVVWIWLGGIFGSAIASVTTEYLHPFYIFTMYAVMGVIYSTFAFCIEDIEADENARASENIDKSLKHLSRPIVYRWMIFIFVSRAIIPSYSDILYYWFINVLNFSKSTIAILALVAFITAIMGSFSYNWFLKKLEFRTTMIVAHIVIAIAVLGIFWLVTRISKNIFGFNDYLFAFFGDAVIETLFVAFIYMPTLVLQTKIVPKNTEATVYSFFSSLMIFGNQFVSPLFGSFIANIFGVTKDNFDSIGTIVLIEFGLSLAPLALIWILPKNQEIQEFYQQLANENTEMLEIKGRKTRVF